MGDEPKEPRDRREVALTDQQDRFVRGLSLGLSQTEAARMAGYAEPRVAAVRLVRSDAVRAAIRARRNNRIDKLASLSLRELEIIIRDRAISPAVRVKAIGMSLNMAGHTEKPQEDDNPLNKQKVSEMSLAELDAFLLAEKNKRADAAKPVIDQVIAQPEVNPLKDNEKTEPFAGSIVVIEGDATRVDGGDPPMPGEGEP